jgi:NitT/TauT family transport system ATP-binding protein
MTLTLVTPETDAETDVLGTSGPTAATGTTETGNAAVRLIGVGKTFGHGASSVTALDGVDLAVAPGQFVCLLGASGCGKTTLLNLVAGLDAPTAGRIELTTGRPAVVFQEAALMPWLTAAGNVELALRLAGASRSVRRARTAELLELVRLGGAGDKRPHELSGGMRQRVALARALASATYGTSDAAHSLILMDEPFSALDAITRDVLQAELTRIWQATGAAVLFVTHDVREAVRLGQRVVLLSSRPGRVVEQWDVDGLSGLDELAVVDEVNVRLREVISSHAHRD